MQRSPQLESESERESVLHMPLKRLLEGCWVVCDAGNGQMAVQASQWFSFMGRSICTLDWWKGCLSAVVKYSWGKSFKLGIGEDGLLAQHPCLGDIFLFWVGYFQQAWWWIEKCKLSEKVSVIVLVSCLTMYVKTFLKCFFQYCLSLSV